MNRQEAIAELKWVKKINQEILNTDAKELDIDCAWIKHWKSVIEALNLAISSLETDEAYQLEYEQPEFCADCISRAEVLKLMKDNWHTHNGDWAMQESMDDIRALPSVYPKKEDYIKANEQLTKQIEMLKLDRDCEKPSGEWVKDEITERSKGEYQYKCNQCGCYHRAMYDYCPSCGAKMGENT